MKTRVLTFLSFTFLAALLALAATPFDGRWEGAIGDGASARKVVLDLKGDGASVTGTIAIDGQPPEPIREGRIEGSEITFKHETVISRVYANEIYTGRLKGDQIDFRWRVERRAGETAFSVKRAKTTK